MVVEGVCRWDERLLEGLMLEGLCTQVSKPLEQDLGLHRPDLHVSSPSKTPGIPTRSKRIPSSASASMFRGCSRATRPVNEGTRY